MGENKNIDKFFKDRLEMEKTPDWATPSDDIWIAAKSKFNNKEKRKRGFIFWLFGSGLLILSLLVIGYLLNHKNDENLQLNQNAIIINQTVDGNSKNHKINIETKSSLSSDLVEETPIKQSKVTSNLVSSFDGSPSNKPNPTGKVTNDINNNNTSVKKTNQQKINLQSTDNDSEDQYYRTSYENGVVSPTRDLENSEIADFQSNQMAKLESGSVSRIEDGLLLNIELLNRSNELTIIPSSKLENNIGSVRLINATSPVLLTRPRYEVGVSHSKFLISAFLDADVIEDEAAELNNLKFSINNINVSGRKWINKKWSYSLGVNFSRLDINTDIDVLDTLDSDLNNFINDKYAISRSNLKPEFPNVGLIDGAELNVGDVINVKGNVDLRLMAVQFPLIMDYHIYKGKMEYLFGAGLSLDFLNVSQDEIDISIYKDQEKINKPYVQEPVSEFMFDYSVYANMGIKYHLHKNWNVGLSTKISILDPVFSYAELGLYYRWHR